jgi:diaminopimelate decarboxylase/aspartate kinase
VRLAAAAGATVTGLHAHTGSGHFEIDAWTEVAATLAGVAARFPAVRVLDLGGGLGVPDKAGRAPVDLAGLGRALAEFRRREPRFALWLEPGRYLVAAAGVLLARVTQLKGKGATRYVGVATGMNSLIRPALYGAHHEIVNLTRLEDAATEVFEVVGPICESADVLGHERPLPPTVEGDVLLIATTGAYGHSMSSRYNLREPAEELLLPAPGAAA